MGGRGNTGTRNTPESKFSTLPETTIKPLAPTKLAKDIFDREYAKMRNLARDMLERGEYNSGGYTSIQQDNDPSFSNRMLQGIQSQITTEWERIQKMEKVDASLGLSRDERVTRQRYALIMLQRMLNQYWKGQNEG